MDFIKQSDLDKIQAYAGQDVDDNKHDELKIIYEKLNYLCSLVKAEGFEYAIRRDPRKQAGPGIFKFQEYHWAQIYPPELFSACNKKFCYIIGLSDSLHFHMMGIKEYQHKPPSMSSSKKSWTEVNIENSNYAQVVKEFIAFDKKFRYLFLSTAAELGIEECLNFKNNYAMQNQIELLKFKKQIILQGPPGTGKTRLAKIIAKDLVSERITISNEDISNLIRIGDEIPTITDFNSFIVTDVTVSKIQVQPNGAKHSYPVMINDLLDCIKSGGHNKPVKESDAKGTGSYKVALSKYAIEQYGQKYIKLIQFHPSYTYDDFVRGIGVKPYGDKVLYEAENRVLGDFAEIAFRNYIDSKKDVDKLSKERWLLDLFEKFKEHVNDQIEDTGAFKINKTASITAVEEDAFRYSGSTWQSEFRMKYNDLILLISNNVKERQEVKKLQGTSGLAKTHSSYFKFLLDQFYTFSTKEKYKPVLNSKEPLRNYVLIIDEINRANLPAVLGELIYALEYRGEAVESMYEIEGFGKKIILPPNLYIIGTMNTADRSVGHIDYAIRRSFAFAEIVPDISVLDEVIKDVGVKEKAKGLFQRVSILFNEKTSETDDNKTYLQSDFKSKDVQIGHSYFLAKTHEELTMKLNFEIRPILYEYLKDGVFRDEAKEIIDSLEFDV